MIITKKKLYIYTILLLTIGLLSFFFYHFFFVKAEKLKLNKTTSSVESLFENYTINDQQKINRLYKQSLIDNNYERLARISYHKVRFWSDSNTHDSIMYYGQKALFFVHQINDSLLEARINYELGAYYSSNKNYTKSLTYLLKAKNIFEQTNFKNGKAHTYNLLGGVYIELNNNKEAIFYYNKSKQLFEKANDTIGKALVYGNISKLLTADKKYKQAEENLLYTLNFFELKEDTLNIINASILLGDNLLLQDSIKLSLFYYDKAYNYAILSKNINQQGHVLLHFANVYFNTNENDKALENYLKGYQLCDYSVDSENLFNIAELYTKKNDYKNAYKYNKLYHTLIDSIKGASVQLQIANLQWENDLSKQTYENNLLIKQKEFEIQEYLYQKRKYVNLSIASIFLIIIISLMYVNRNKSLKITRLQNSKLEENILLEKEYQHLLTKQHQIELKSKTKLQLIEQKQHAIEVENKNRELVAINLQLLSKNKVLRELQLVLQNKKGDSLKNIQSILKGHLDDEKNWEYFQEIFQKIHPTFFSQLQNICPELTKTELRICAYIKINMSNIEMASLLNINVNSILTTRYRIRKKINLERENNLDEWIQAIH